MDLRLKQLNLALERFEEAMDALAETKCEERNYTLFRDSVIQRFEFTSDLFWKVLKDYLMKKHKIEVASPRSTVKESFAQKIIDEQESKIFYDMIDDRNDTSHRYDSMMADEIVQRTRKYHQFMMLVQARVTIH